MADPSPDPPPTGGESPDGSDAEETTDDGEHESVEELRAAVEEAYDFDDFGPQDMAEMSREEWEAVFDEETWITGERLLDRLQADLEARVASRDVFARIERLASPERVVAYSDEGYAVVYEDGAIEGEGTVLRDVKPSVALCSMDDYEVPERPAGELLPDPVEVPEGSGELGNLMLQVAAAVQLLAGVALLGAVVVGAVGDAGAIAAVAGLALIGIGGFLLFTVANARLSDRFRAEEYRNRLRAVGAAGEEPPEWLPASATEELVEADEQGPADGDRNGET